MLDSLENLKANPAITLLRCRFLGYPNDVKVIDSEVASADLFDIRRGRVEDPS